jgi:hypothetical protein
LCLAGLRASRQQEEDLSRNGELSARNASLLPSSSAEGCSGLSIQCHSFGAEEMKYQSRIVAKLILLFVLVVLCAGVSSKAQSAPGAGSSSDPWWKHAVIYEIYPRSFQDSNGDGVGDINGIISRLDYLKDLGVDAIWITPMYPSPLVDFGYDISDYQAIDRQYGTMADMKRLIAEARKRNLRVIMDMVLNHTSDQHP